MNCKYTNKYALATRLKALRRKYNVTQVQLGQSSRILHSQISGFEKGSRGMTDAALRKIDDYFAGRLLNGQLPPVPTFQKVSKVKARYAKNILETWGTWEKPQ